MTKAASEYNACYIGQKPRRVRGLPASGLRVSGLSRNRQLAPIVSRARAPAKQLSCIFSPKETPHGGFNTTKILIDRATSATRRPLSRLCKVFEPLASMRTLVGLSAL